MFDIYNDQYFHRNIPETWFRQNGLLRPDQLAALCYVFDWPFWKPERTKRKPGKILSVGCGIGFLEKKLEDMGCRVIGFDPYFSDEYMGKECLTKYNGETCDTLLFCESLEHLDIKLIMQIIDNQPKGCRVVITNWPDYHPIPTNGADHITEVNDELFDRLLDGREPIIRRGSHLVYEK